jgi:hypothetical protein
MNEAGATHAERQYWGGPRSDHTMDPNTRQTTLDQSWAQGHSLGGDGTHRTITAQSLARAQPMDNLGTTRINPPRRADVTSCSHHARTKAGYTNRLYQCGKDIRLIFRWHEVRHV